MEIAGGAEATDVDVGARERLIRAAIEVFLEKGYLDTRISDISRRSHYTSGAIYMHFGSRSDLLNQAILSAGEDYITDLAGKVEVLPAGLEGFSTLLAGLSIAEPGPFESLLVMALALETHEHGRGRSWITALTKLDRTVADLIAQNVAAGLVDPSIDPDALRTLLSAWLLGTIVHRALGLSAADVEASERLHRHLAPGLVPPDIRVDADDG